METNDPLAMRPGTTLEPQENEAENATSFVKGSHLATRDGRNIGNAMITDVEGSDPAIYYVETDFGNTCEFSYAEMISWFFLPTHETDPFSWRMDRLLLIDPPHHHHALELSDDDVNESLPSQEVSDETAD